MIKKYPKFWAAIASVIIVTIPVLLAFRLASIQSAKQHEREAAQLSTTILQRIETMAEQVDRAEQMVSIQGLQNCSPEHLRLLTRLSVESPLVIGFGYSQGNTLVCSSLGPLGANLDLGMIDYRSSRGRDIRISRPLSGISERSLHISINPKNGFTAMLHPEVAIGLMTGDPSISLGIINTSFGSVLVRRGVFESAWYGRLGDLDEVRFFDGNYVVAIRKSNKFDAASYVAIPLEAVDRVASSLILLLVPVGIGSGFILAYLFFRFTQHRMSVLWQFKQALHRKQLFLVYQPIVALQDGRWVGAEALIRWRHADGTMVSPDIFIPMAERNELIGQVTAEVIRLFVADLRDMLRKTPDFYVSVNFSAHDLKDSWQVQALHRAIVSAGLHPRNVRVEATERGMLDAEQTGKVLQELKELGFKVAIDDFGTGYSSLSYLTDLRVDGLKIDKAFVETIGTDAATSHVVAHIIEMAKSLDLTMVAEGVETPAQADYLRARGVQFAQGWLYAKPMSAAELMKGLQQSAA